MRTKKQQTLSENVIRHPHADKWLKMPVRKGDASIETPPFSFLPLSTLDYHNGIILTSVPNSEAIRWSMSILTLYRPVSIADMC